MEVLPHLFLGNCENSKDIDCLREHGIKHIVNVTQDVPNMFERDDVNIRYLRIPIKDHWSENLSDFFYKAIVFIGEFSFSLHNTHSTRNTLRCNMQHTTLQHATHYITLQHANHHSAVHSNTQHDGSL